MKILLALAMLAGGSGFAGERLVEGLATSPVRVVIYEDLQCSDCAEFRRMMDEKLLPRYAAKVAFEHRDFPLAKHAWARKAAIASRYFESVRPELAVDWRKWTMAHQDSITLETFDEKLSMFAKEYKLVPGKALAALRAKALAEAVEADYVEGVARGIAHTPTVFVNSQPFIENFPVEEISKAIDAELAASK